MSETFVRPASRGDEEFPFNVYASTRLAELGLMGWSREQQESFLRMRYNVRRWAYEAEFPKAAESILDGWRGGG